MVVETGVFATDSEDEEITKLYRQARSTPVIVFKSGDQDWASKEFHRMNQRIHCIAMSRGLPEIPGFYGYDGRTREFTKWQPDTQETPVADHHGTHSP